MRLIIFFNAVEVAGKNYKKFSDIKRNIKVTPLLWVCEVVFGAHVENDLPKNWFKLVEQYSLKVIETLTYKVGKGVNFAKYGSIIVLIGTSPNEKTRALEKEIQPFERKKDFKIKFVTIPGK